MRLSKLYKLHNLILRKPENSKCRRRRCNEFAVCMTQICIIRFLNAHGSESTKICKFRVIAMQSFTSEFAAALRFAVFIMQIMHFCRILSLFHTDFAGLQRICIGGENKNS